MMNVPGLPAMAAFGALATLATALVAILLVRARRDRQALARLQQQLEERSAKLASARRRFQGFLDAVPSMIGYWDRNLINRVSNRAYQDWLGVEVGNLRGKHVRDVLGEALYQINRPYIEATLRGEAQTFERELARPDGSRSRHSLAQYFPDVVDGAVRGFYEQVFDITELVESRTLLSNALRDNQSLLRTIDLHSIVSVTDGAGRIVEVNDNFCRISGYCRDELLGQTHGIVNSGVQDRAFWTSMWRTIASGQPWRGEICNRARDGSLYWVDSIIAPYRGADGRIEKYVSIRTDVTAARLTENRLRSSEEFLDRAGTVAGLGGWELDLRTREVTWSAQTYCIHEVAAGYRPCLADGLNFYAPEGRPIIERAVAAAMAHGTGWDLELPFVTAQGREIWVRTVGVCEFEDGAAVKMTGTFQDITAPRQIKANLVQANERFAVATEAAGIGVWEFDVAQGNLTWDDRMYQIYGANRSAAAEPYTLWTGLLHPDDRARCEDEIAAALRGEGEFDTEFRIVRPDGELRYLKANSRIQRRADGGVERMTGANADVTERRRAELELRKAEMMLRTVLQSVSEVAIIATDPDLSIKVFNAGAERMLGYTSGEVVGRATPILIHDADEVHARGTELTARLGVPIEGAAALVEPSTLQTPREWTYVRKDGGRIAVSLAVNALQTDAGELLGHIGVAHDVTARKRYEASIREAMHKAERANRAKSEFLANISHEIRTPMNAVIGLSYLMGRTALDPEQAAFLAHIKLASNSLLGVINSVLDLSKIEAGELIVERVAFSPRALLMDLSDVMAVQADAKGIAFSVDAADDLPEAIEGDALRLSQVLTNLLSNAIKFTDHGSVALQVRRLAVNAHQVTLSFVVQDTGIGIAPDAQARLFTPFAQADASITRRFGGTGLGLSIVKHLVGVMGGQVRVQSTPGVGSEFTIELDFALAAPLAPVATARASVGPGGCALLGVRVLVVDDSDINLDVAKRILELEGARVGLAGNGLEAFDLLRARPQGYDVVLMDVQMPVLDGHAATRRIRDELGLAALPIIALTAGALSSERQRAAAAGMDDFIIKPFDVDSLVGGILRHARPVARLAAFQDATPPPAPLAPPVASSGALVAGQDAAPDGPPGAALHAEAQGPRTPAAVPWPQIDGVDATAARKRLNDDLALFLSILERLLDEFADVTLDAAAAAATGPAQLATHAGRLHKLKGSAGMVGATRIHELASAAEAACVAGEGARAARLAATIAAQLLRLRQGAAATFEAARVEDALAERPALAATADRPDRASLEPQLLADLVTLLRQQSLVAIERFNFISPELRRLLGQDAYARVRRQLNDLQFSEVADALAAVGP